MLIYTDVILLIITMTIILVLMLLKQKSGTSISWAITFRQLMSQVTTIIQYPLMYPVL